jgi:acetoin utilization deacetylase AcuC-like enzyme
VTTRLITHPACLDHDPGAHHPENPARLAVILKRLQGKEFDALIWQEAPRAPDEALARAHPGLYVQRLLGAVPPAGGARIDADTIMSPGSGEAAIRAAGAVMAGVDAVALGEAKNAFCAVRPPGHHAEPDRAMGFCLFNNVAVGAYHARAAHGLRRVAVVDFDVHHGNGTQAMFEADPDAFYASTHQYPLYPGTGAAAERGVAGNIVNVPLSPGAGSSEFRAAVTHTLLPQLEAFGPDILLVSAGFDAHKADPLAGLALETEDYFWVTQELAALAGRVSAGRLVSTLEGGYDLEALADSAAAHVRALMAV